MARKKAGHTTIVAHILNASDDVAAIAAIDENLARTNLSPIEILIALRTRETAQDKIRRDKAQAVKLQGAWDAVSRHAQDMFLNSNGLMRGDQLCLLP